MTGEVGAREQLAAGAGALADGDWHAAEERFTAALAAAEDADRALAAAGQSDARWWLGDVEGALQARRTAYEAWRRAGDDHEAARSAVWLSREYLGALGNDAAARGWLTRAETLAGEVPAPDIAGWIALTRAALQADRAVQRRAADEAIALARASRDGDLEAMALARKGLVLVTDGDLDDGVACFDEAMALATGGEASLATLGNLCCDLVLATELWGDVEPFARWNDVIVRIAEQHGHPPLVSFCATCCAEVFTVGGDWAGAEEQLRAALALLEATGHHARCAPPTAKLSELLLLQGRLEEAEELLRDDVSQDTLVVRARLELARRRPGAAVVLLERACRRLGGDSLVTVPALAVLVDAHLAAGGTDAAAEVAVRLGALAERSANRRVAGRASLARARVELARHETDAAIASLEAAMDHLDETAPGSIELADAHLELAVLQRQTAPDVALAEAKAALGAYEAVGASARADEAAALARALGDRSRVGAKGLGTLTGREQEVLRLLAQGLTNAELAERLYISPKTAGNHVSSILTKLHLRSRAEAAAYALTHTEP